MSGRILKLSECNTIPLQPLLSLVLLLCRGFSHKLACLQGNDQTTLCAHLLIASFSFLLHTSCNHRASRPPPDSSLMSWALYHCVEGPHSSAIDQELQLLPQCPPPTPEIRASGRRGRAHVDVRSQIGCDQHHILTRVMKIPWWSNSHWDQLEGEGLTEATETCKDHPCAHMMEMASALVPTSACRSKSAGFFATTCRTVPLALWRCGVCPIALSKFC